MRTLSTTVLLSSLFFANPLLAGPGEDHSHGHGHSHSQISSDEAAGKAMEKVRHLADSGRIDGSWTELEPASVEQKTYSQGPEWVVTFNNEGIGDPSKQRLYMFFSLDGHYIASNYTGN